MPWQELEASVSHLFAKKVRAGKVIDEADQPGFLRGDEVASNEKLVTTLKIISQAVVAGELDTQIAAAGATLRARFVK